MVLLNSPYFQAKEFKCPCGCGKGLAEMDQGFIDRLEKAREIADVPFKLNSAYRCHLHNQAVGGVRRSAHTRGYAVDIMILDDLHRAIINNALHSAGFRRMGFARGFTHVDCDPTKNTPRQWIY